MPTAQKKGSFPFLLACPSHENLSKNCPRTLGTSYHSGKLVLHTIFFSGAVASCLDAVRPRACLEGSEPAKRFLNQA